MLRFQEHIRSAVSAHAVLSEAGGKHVITGVEHLLYYLNGDWRMQRLQTHRIAQVAGEAGAEDVRKATCEQVFAALTGTSCLFGGLNTIPAKSRWGTCSKVLATQICSILVRSLVAVERSVLSRLAV